MPKRIVVCCDGTWNTATQKHPTNVVKLYNAIQKVGVDGVTQCAYYHSGVGTQDGERIRGGAFGFGLSRHVQDAYRYLVRNYEPDDEIFLFGFSRGAYTARSTAGFIRNCGVLRGANEDRIDEAYKLYRGEIPPDDPRSQEFRKAYSYEPRIRCIGVWDTVGALGIPLSGLRLLNRRWQFHDMKLSSQVDCAFQALSIDEKRKPFVPTIWEPPKDAPGQRLEQVWFAGCHSDVGGGCDSSGLSDIALRWIASRVHGCGLTTDILDAPNDFLAVQENSLTFFYRLLGSYDRELGKTDAVHEFAASTVVERRDGMTNPEYKPANLTTYLGGNHQIMPL
jgi:uncharacterized protein (DUF2235 family)